MNHNRPGKLVLSRETLRNLTRADLADVAGGGTKPSLHYNCVTTDMSNRGGVCVMCVNPC